MLKAVYIMKVKAGSSRNLNDILKLVSYRTKYVLGCLESKIWHNRETSEIMLCESWRSLPDLETHIVSQLYKQLLAALELSSEKPVIRFYDCEKTRGIDLVEEVLANHKDAVL